VGYVCYKCKIWFAKSLQIEGLMYCPNCKNKDIVEHEEKKLVKEYDLGLDTWRFLIDIIERVYDHETTSDTCRTMIDLELKRLIRKK